MAENTTTILELVKTKIAESTPIVKQRLTGMLVDREVDRRVEMLDKALAKLSELRRSEAKCKPDNVTVSDDGTKQQNFSTAKYEERKKLREKTVKLEKAIDAALEGESKDAFQKLKEALDKS